MSNKYVIPVILLIICLLIIYGIINSQYNKVLIYNIEKFQATSEESNDNNPIIQSILNNSQITTDIANGTWTTLATTVNPNYTVNGTMTIQINNSTSPTGNLGTITYQTGQNNQVQTFEIISLIQNNLTAVLENDRDFVMNISFVGLFNQTEIDNIKKQTYFIADNQMAIVTLYMNNVFLKKYLSYKIVGNTVGSNLYRIILSKNFIINNPPPIYNYSAYNKIVNNYVFPNNYISFQFGQTNNNILNIIQTNYLGNIQFSIKRVFATPEKNTIMTFASPPISLSAIQNGQIPTNIVVCPIQEDFNINGLNSGYYPPQSTWILFYKYVTTNVTYGYSNSNPIVLPSSVMNFANGGDSMYNANIEYNDITSVYQENDNEYNIVLMKSFPTPPINEPLIVPFSHIYDLL